MQRIHSVEMPTHVGERVALVGHVVDASSSAPIVSGTVQLADATGTPIATCMTAADVELYVEQHPKGRVHAGRKCCRPPVRVGVGDCRNQREPHA